MNKQEALKKWREEVEYWSNKADSKYSSRETIHHNSFNEFIQILDAILESLITKDISKERDQDISKTNEPVTDAEPQKLDPRIPHGIPWPRIWITKEQALEIFPYAKADERNLAIKPFDKNQESSVWDG